MTRTNLLLLVGVFVGGATPWLEAIVVIPAGVIAGLHPVPAVIAGVAGNLATVALAAWFGERIRIGWLARRSRRRVALSGGDGPAGEGPADNPGRADRTSRRRQRVERIARRWGLPALATLGPIGLGTQVSAVVAVGMGVNARTAFAWVGAGTVAWSILAAAAAVAGLSLAGGSLFS